MHSSPVLDEAARLINRLAGYAERMHPNLAHLPGQMFQQLCGVDDIDRWVDEAEGFIGDEPAYRGRADFILAVLRACANCAHAARLPDGMGWPALLDAERHAGVALAAYVSTLEGKDRRAAFSRAGKDAQVEVNDAIKTYVLQQAADSAEKDVKKAAESIVAGLGRAHGNLKAAMGHFASSLKPVDTTLASTFSEYIRKNIDELVPSDAEAEKRTPRQRFARWKEDFGLPGKPNH